MDLNDTQLERVRLAQEVLPERLMDLGDMDPIKEALPHAAAMLRGLKDAIEQGIEDILLLSNGPHARARWAELDAAFMGAFDVALADAEAEGEVPPDLSV